jgi:proteasome lid subunit RPN8/RPN11
MLPERVAADKTMLIIQSREYESLRRHGEETHPFECCGVLLGRITDAGPEVEDVVRCSNTRADRPQDRYNIDPKELLRLQRHADERGLDIVGFYHSHPDQPAQWSQTDLAEAHWLGCSYVITSVETGRAARTCSFVLAGATEEDKRLEPEDITVLSFVEK